MAVTVATVRNAGDVHGNQRITVTDVTMDASYVTGGEPVTAAQLGLNFVHIAVGSLVSGAAGAAVEYVPLPQTDGSVLLRANAASGVQVANAVDLSSNVVRVVAFGY